MAANERPGIAPGLLRCSVGLEDADDLEADFAVALDAARRAVGLAGGAGATAPRVPVGPSV